MNRIAKYATAAALAGALAIPAVTPSSAATWHHGHGGIGPGAAIGFAAGAMVGAAAASAYGPSYYTPGYAYEPGYAYAPGYAYDSYDAAYAYEPGPAYGAYAYQPAPRVYRTHSNRNEQRCTLSPASVNYVPCNNHW